MNEPELCDTLSSQSENRSGYMNGHMKNKGFSLQWWKGRKGQSLLLNNRTDLDMHCFSFHTFLSSLTAVLFAPFLSLAFWLSHKIPAVCSVWKDPSFIKPLLSIKKMKCSPGPHQLEPSPPPLPYCLSCFISLFGWLCHTPSLPSTALLWSLSCTRCHLVSTFKKKNSASQYLILSEFSCPFQGVRPISAGLESDLGSGGGLVGVWCNSHQ